MVTPPMKDWNEMREMSARLLIERTGKSVAEWNNLIAALNPSTEAQLRGWLSENGVTGYAQGMLVMERFGYPDFFLHSAAELINLQFQVTPTLRPIFDAILTVVSEIGGVTIQARKTYVSLLTPRRTFARVQPSKKGILILALRVSEASISSRLFQSKLHETTPYELRLRETSDLDAEVIALLHAAIEQNQ